MANLSCIPKFVKKEIVDIWVAETWKLMLMDKTFVPNAATQRFAADVIAKQIPIVDGDAYSDPVVIANKRAVADPAILNNYFIDADDTVIGPSTTINYRFGVVYKDMGTGDPAVNPIRAQIDFITDQIVYKGTSTIKWNTLGIIYIS